MYIKSCVLLRPRFHAWFLSCEVRWGSTPICFSRGCGLLSQVSCYEHYNVTVHLWISQFVYHWYHLLYVGLYTICISYLVRCIGQRCGVFPCCILVIVKCQVLTCYDVRQVGVVFSERGAWVLDGVGVGFFNGWWGFSRASKILFENMECSSFKLLFFENSA